MDNLFKIDEEVDIDLTPLIDVIFMLLIFFIMTTTFTKPVLEIILPESEMAEENTLKNMEVLIYVKKEGSLYHENIQISEEELIVLLQLRKDALLNVFVDKDAPFKSFVNIVDIAKRERGGRFVISTEAKPTP